MRDALRTDLKAGRAAVLAAFEAGGPVTDLLHGLRRLVDGILARAWEGVAMPAEAGLGAVGGYGRGELFPYSDVDVLLLLPAAPDAAMEARIESFIGLCWDLGLEIASSVRTVDECVQEAALDVTIQTSLLEMRLLTGSRSLFRKAHESYLSALDPKLFFRAKMLEVRQRHARYQDTPYSLEPNCKESPGGLRDLQVIIWVCRAAGLGSSWRELFQKGLLTRRELFELTRNERLLKTIRARLHIIAGRRQDVLVFDLQNALAGKFDLHDTTQDLGMHGARRASEQLMRKYYWAAKAASQLNTILVQNAEALLFPRESQVTRVLGEHFVEKQGMIEIADDLLYERQPLAILETFLVFVQTPEIKGLSVKTLRALYNARGLMDAKWRGDPVNRKLFLQIMQSERGITHALRLMNQTSVLGRYLVAFRRIVGQMQHDLFHVYTVDQHILMVVRNVRRFAIVEHTHEFPLCSELMAKFDKPWVLVVAALFHDIAKGRGGDHSTLGEVDARRFCRQHGIAREDTDLIVWLVEQHLTMSQVAQKQDLGDPEVIRRFAALVGSERYLVALYLLTVADVRGTSPKVWNAWKGSLLENLFRSTLRSLGGSAPEPGAELEQRREETLGLLRLAALPENAQDELWSQLDVGFFMRHDADDIAWLTRHLYNRVADKAPVVRGRFSPFGEGLEIAVYVPDQPDLFARLCGYFEQKGLAIREARIHTTRQGYALDTFQVVDAGHDVDVYRAIITQIEHELAQQLATEAPLPEPRQGRLSRQSRFFPINPRVELRPDERGQYFLLSLSAADRTGLLYAIARVLAKHGVSLQTARIHTLGERVEDVFLVDGSTLAQDQKHQIRLETDLLEALTP
ncbi:MAG: [protein-PII] uridylyltransferase [Candidatus Protistobacter heckmanni]|nr:[protein-PII] uridylyltransferase [Candidatus Protistobacter heckmanni]